MNSISYACCSWSSRCRIRPRAHQTRAADRRTAANKKTTIRAMYRRGEGDEVFRVG